MPFSTPLSIPPAAAGLAAAVLALAPAALAQTAPAAATAGAAVMATANADVADASGKALGTVTIADTPSGQLHVTVALTGLPPGPHGIHIHEAGTCEPPDFASAGGHLAGGHEHGVLAPGGTHQGDLPNVTADAQGNATAEYFSTGVSVADVTDADGGTFMVHADADDYHSQPAGESGGRIACGVFTAAP